MRAIARCSQFTRIKYYTPPPKPRLGLNGLLGPAEVGSGVEGGLAREAYVDAKLGVEGELPRGAYVDARLGVDEGGLPRGAYVDARLGVEA